ncbi:hypothetical protein EDD15DRAFT_2371481 [Pisolithus albus]|nr:hypothetical protein EDD15DRAFT_2371481 [Pisolithus albus]
MAPTDKEGKGKGGWQEIHLAAFFNAVALAIKLSLKAQEKTSVVERYWLGSYSPRRMPGTVDGASAYHHKLDLILVEKSDLENIVPPPENTPYLVLLNQPWRRFVLDLSVARQQLRIHFYDHSGCSISLPFDIHSNPKAFVAILAAIMFGPRQCIGFDPNLTIRPTLPLQESDDVLAHPGPNDFVQPVTLPNCVETITQNALRAFILPPGMNANILLTGPTPTQVTRSTPDQTSTPNNPAGPVGVIQVHDTFMKSWKSCSRQAVIIIRDVLLIQQDTVQKGFLHRDTSPFNVLFKDTLDRVHRNGVYSVGGMGTIPFLSINLLVQILHVLEQRSKSDPKGTMDAHFYQQGEMISAQVNDDDFEVEHMPADDIETLFYVLIWILVLYDGPLGWEQQGFDFKSSILGQWSEGTIQNLRNAKNSKSLLIVFEDHHPLQKCMSPYFSDLIPLADDWRQTFRKAFVDKRVVDIGTLLDITNMFLSKMPLEEPPEITNEHLTKQAEKGHITHAYSYHSHKAYHPACDLPLMQLSKRPKEFTPSIISGKSYLIL